MKSVSWLTYQLFLYFCNSNFDWASLLFLRALNFTLNIRTYGTSTLPCQECFLLHFFMRTFTDNLNECSLCWKRGLLFMDVVSFYIILVWMLSPFTSVPDPPDPHVFGPPGSGSISQRYGSGSGSFYDQAKIVRKNIDSYCFVTSFGLFLSLKNDVNVPSKCNKQKNFFF